MFLKLRHTSDPSDDESDLLREYRETGDLRILGKLYERHMELLYAVCYKYLRDEDEAKDASWPSSKHSSKKPDAYHRQLEKLAAQRRQKLLSDAAALGKNPGGRFF